jgi:hypothetical protein
VTLTGAQLSQYLRWCPVCAATVFALIGDEQYTTRCVRCAELYKCSIGSKLTYCTLSQSPLRPNFGRRSKPCLRRLHFSVSRAALSPLVRTRRAWVREIWIGLLGARHPVQCNGCIQDCELDMAIKAVGTVVFRLLDCHIELVILYTAITLYWMSCAKESNPNLSDPRTTRPNEWR